MKEQFSNSFRVSRTALLSFPESLMIVNMYLLMSAELQLIRPKSYDAILNGCPYSSKQGQYPSLQIPDYDFE
jgi:hypothetical protein